jgi:hypothetical protein
MLFLLNPGIEGRGVAGETRTCRVREPQCPFQYPFQDYAASQLWFLADSASRPESSSRFGEA